MKNSTPHGDARKKICTLKQTISFLLLHVLATVPVLAESKVLLEEDFESYTLSGDIVTSGGWSSQPVTDAGCLPPYLRDDATKYIKLSFKPTTQTDRNGMIFRSFVETSNSEVNLSFCTLHTEGERMQSAGLFDANRRQGYVVCWTAGPAPTKGTLFVWKYLAPEPITWGEMSRITQLLSKRDPAADGMAEELARTSKLSHDSQSPPLASFRFIINQRTGEFSLYQDDECVLSGADNKPIQALSQVVLQGSSGLFDEIKVEADSLQPK